MKSRLTHFFVLALMVTLVCINFYWAKPLLPGFDTPFYLTEIRSFISKFPNFFDYRYNDRYLSILFPTLISKIFNLDPITSLRIAFSSIYLFISFSLFILFENITKNKLASLALSAALIVSPFMLTYSTLFYANFAGLFVMFTFFAIETSKKFKYKPIVLLLVYLLIFLTHNFTSVTMTLIILCYYYLKYVYKQKKLVSISMLILYIILAVAGIICISKNCYSGIIQIHGQPALLGNEVQRTIGSLVEHSGKYWLIFFPIFTLITIFLAKNKIITERRKFILPLAIFLPSIIFSFQPYLNLNYLPERFMSLVVLSSFFFYTSCITLSVFKKHVVLLSLIPLLLSYLSSDVLIMDKGYRSFSQEETVFYQNIDKILPKNSLLLISSDQKYWSKYFLDGRNIKTGNSLVSCGYINSEDYFKHTDFTQLEILSESYIQTATNFILAELLSETDVQKANEYLNEIKLLYPTTKIYIVSNTKSCAHGQILQSLQSLTNVSSISNFTLYEVH